MYKSCKSDAPLNSSYGSERSLRLRYFSALLVAYNFDDRSSLPKKQNSTMISK